MPNTLQTLLNAFSRNNFLSKFHRSVFQTVSTSLGSDDGLWPGQTQAIIWTCDDLIDLFHHNFSHSGKLPEHRKLSHEL